MRRIMALLAIGVLSLATGTVARGETLQLSPEAASACPGCTTPTGGAEVVNLFATLAPQNVSMTAGDSAAPPPEGYVHAAERMTNDAESLDQLLPDGDHAAADDVEHGLMHGLTMAGAVPTAGAICVEAAYVCGIVFLGAAAAFVIVGPKPLSVFIDGGDSDDGIEIHDIWWQRSGSDQHLLDWTRGPFVGAGEWYLVYSTGGGNWSWMHHGAPAGCDFGPPPPRSSMIRDGLGNICVNDLPLQAYVRTDEMMFSARHPSKHVDSPPPGATSVNPPPTPSRSSMADAAAAALNGHPDLAAWINYELGVPGAQDPVTGKVIVPNCDGLTWIECRDQITGFGFATPVKLEIPQDEAALAPDADAGRVALVEGEKTGHDPDDVLGVAVLPETLASPRTAPVPDVDVFVETDTDVTTEESGTCDLSAAVPATGPVQANAFDPYPSLVGQGLTYAVDTDSDLSLPGSDLLRPAQTLLRTGAVRTNSSGFGWRHLVARHGWIAKDEELTRLVLSTPRHAIERTVTTKVGALDTYYATVASGAWYFHRTASRLYVCARRVVLKPDQLDGWGPVPPPTDGPLPDQAGVWTSYGKALDEAPLP